MMFDGCLCVVVVRGGGGLLLAVSVDPSPLCPPLVWTHPDTNAHRSLQLYRRMMYLFIKEVAETCNPDDVIIVTSSLTKVGREEGYL